MAWAVATVGLAWCAAFVLICHRMGEIASTYADRWFALYEVIKAPPVGTSEPVEFPDDIKSAINRYARKDSRDSEAAYFRELYLANGKDWAKVRVAAEMTP